jgi:polysaccharide pyruvyl transferase WcaK-like protein
VPLCVGLIRTIASSLLGKIDVSTGDPFTRSDVIIDLNSDALNEYYGIVYPLFTLLNIMFASLSGKPVVVAPCSIGTFKNPFIRRFASFALNRTRVIVVRELISIDNLHRLNVSRPKVVFASDLAFLFEPENAEETKKKLVELGIDKEKRPLIGIAPSQIIHYYAFHQKNEPRSKKRMRYINLMAEFADFIVEKIGATVMLVPHSYSETGDLASYADLDDRDACRDIYMKARNQKYVIPVLESYGADKIKGLIGSCDVFIACRMHASIAATSQCVPTIVLSYGTKFKGIIGDLIDQKDQIVNAGDDYDTVLDQLKTKTMKAWEDRRSVRRSLQSTLPQVRKSARSLLISLCQFLEDE